MRVIALCLFIGLAMVLESGSCKKNCGNSSFAEQISKVTGPDTGSVNKTITKTITYSYGGCESFTGITDSIKGNNHYIRAMVTTPNCSTCDQVLRIGTTNYTFTPTATGTYYLQYLESGATNIIDTIRIK